ncbi:glycosyltransferase family 9 protein, partial [bacterium]|nr:glycosyltransferase family 9 protein [bacterium]
MPAPEPKRIVIIDWSMIGDLIMLSPCVRAIRQRFGEAYIALLGQPGSIAAYKRHPGLNELIPYDRSHGDLDLASFRTTVAALRERRFDLAFIFHNSFGSALMAAAGRVPQRIGYRHELRDLLLTRRFRLPEEPWHLIEIKANLLSQYGIEVEDLSEEVYIDEGQAGRWLKETLGPNFGRSRPMVAVSMGATLKQKIWPSEILNEMLNMFPVNSCDFVFTGTPAERALFEGVYSYNNTVVDLVGQTTLEELTWVLDRADLYIGPDSGPVHLAVARQTPVVAIFGPTDPKRCGPYNCKSAVTIRAERICSICEPQYG